MSSRDQERKSKDKTINTMDLPKTVHPQKQICLIQDNELFQINPNTNWNELVLDSDFIW